MSNEKNEEKGGNQAVNNANFARSYFKNYMKPCNKLPSIIYTAKTYRKKLIEYISKKKNYG